MNTDKRVVCINGVPVVTDKKTFESDRAALTGYVGSTGLCGGDRKAGGRTYVSLENAGATDMIVTLVTDKNGNGTGFEIAASGDDELITLAFALAHLATVLFESSDGEDEE